MNISSETKLWAMEKPDFNNLISIGDTDGDGKVNEDEFQTIMKEQLGDKYDETKTKELFTKLSNGDETIDAADLANAPHHKPPIQSADLELLISAVDSNKDGVISKEELLAYLQNKLGANFNLAMFLTFFNILSGGDDTISANDLKGLASVNAPRPVDNLSNLIAQGDADEDGELSEDELETLMKNKLGANFNETMFKEFFTALSGGDDKITAADITNFQQNKISQSTTSINELG